MARRTISATGGLWSSATTWVEGVAPGSTDYIVGGSASGNLTVNNAYTVYSAFFNDDYGDGVYTGTITLTNTLNIRTTAANVIGTASFSNLMSFAGTSYLNMGYSAGTNARFSLKTSGLTFSRPISLNGGSTNFIFYFLDDFNFSGFNTSTVMTLNLNSGTINGNRINLYNGWLDGVGAAASTMSLWLKGGSQFGATNFGLRDIYIDGNFRTNASTGDTTDGIRISDQPHRFFYNSGNNYLLNIVQNPAGVPQNIYAEGLTFSFKDTSTNAAKYQVDCVNSNCNYILYQNTTAPTRRIVTLTGTNSIWSIWSFGKISASASTGISNNIEFASGRTFSINRLYTLPMISGANTQLYATPSNSLPANLVLSRDMFSNANDLTDLSFTGGTFYSFENSSFLRTTGATDSLPTGGGTGSGPVTSAYTFLT